jgi:pyridoxal phosphate enzyme (YggS family)
MSYIMSIQANVDKIRQKIHQIESKYHRLEPVQLIAVSKTKPVELIEQAVAAGMTDIAENYLQEALQKQRELSHLKPVWHYIGPIQSNKTAKIAQNFDWVHSVSSFKIAERLSRQRPASMDSLNILIQVNISREESKSGADPESAIELARAIHALPRLSLRGLMAVPAHNETLASQREPFRALRLLLEGVQQATKAEGIDQLSMGMTQDMEAAIAEGSTMLRIGTAIFGAREKRTPEVSPSPEQKGKD